MFNLKKKRLREDIIAVFLYVKGCHREVIVDLFSITLGLKTRTNGWNLNRDRITFKVRMNFLTVNAIKQWNNLPPEFMDVPSLEIFMKRLKIHLSRMV